MNVGPNIHFHLYTLLVTILATHSSVHIAVNVLIAQVTNSLCKYLCRRRSPGQMGAFASWVFNNLSNVSLNKAEASPRTSAITWIQSTVWICNKAATQERSGITWSSRFSIMERGDVVKCIWLPSGLGAQMNEWMNE